VRDLFALTRTDNDRVSATSRQTVSEFVLNAPDARGSDDRPRAKFWASVAAGLRGAHTGQVGDQVAWLAFGSAILCGAIALL